MKIMDYNYFDRYVADELATCETAEQMLTVLAHHYKLDKKLGIITHLAFRQGLKQAVAMLRPEVRNSVPH
jgi:hypothetical protein